MLSAVVPILNSGGRLARSLATHLREFGRNRLLPVRKPLLLRLRWEWSHVTQNCVNKRLETRLMSSAQPFPHHASTGIGERATHRGYGALECCVVQLLLRMLEIGVFNAYIEARKRKE